MQAFSNLIPQPTESKRIRFSCRPPDEPFRQLQSLFSNNLAKMCRQLRPVLEDLEVVSIPKGPPEMLEADCRKHLVRICQERLVRQMLTRNAQARRTIEEFVRLREGKDPEEMATIERRNIQSAQTKQQVTIERYNSYRPKTTPINNRFSRSLIIERRSKESIMNSTNAPQGGRFAMVFLNRAFTPHNRRSSIRRANSFKSPDSVRQPPLATPSSTIPSTSHFQQPVPLPPRILIPPQQPSSPPRFSFIDQNHQQFAPAFGQRRASLSTQNTPITKSGELHILREKIKLLNCEYVVKVAVQQQGYKRKMRNPRNFSSIFS